MRKLGLGVLAVCASCCAASAQEEPRLLPLEMASVAAPVVSLASADDRDIVQFAGGTIEFRLPPGWQAREVPRGRAMLLLVTPGDPPADPRRLRRGLWLAHHRLRVEAATPQRPPLEEFERRRQQAAPRAAPRGAAVAVDGDLPGWRQNLAFASRGERSQRGVHLLSATRFGLLEVHGRAENDDPGWEKGLQTVLETLEVRPPLPLPQPLTPRTEPAAAALGTWKSSQSRLRLQGDGTVEIDFDRSSHFALDSAGNVVYDRPLKRLRGSFDARGDVIHIRWDDGSRQNIRWKIYQGDLLTTDHYGRTSQLRRLFDERG